MHGDSEEMFEFEAPAGADEPVAPYDTTSVVSYIQNCMTESEEARRTRDLRNRANYDAFHGRQDVSNKVRGQSAEFLPKTAMALEQMANFVKSGLVSSGNYFDVEISPSPTLVGGPLTEGQIVKLMRHRLENPGQIPRGLQSFITTVADGVHSGGLASLIVMKVAGSFEPTRRLVIKERTKTGRGIDPLTGAEFEYDDGSEEYLEMEEGKVWRVGVSLIRAEDYFPDPTGKGLYEIERSYPDLYELIDAAENGEYDAEAVAELAGTYMDSERELALARETEQNITTSENHYRHQVEVLHFWGTILDSSGNVVHRNCRAAIANGSFVIRKPEPNPNWHQESPYVAAPLVRVPFSVFHKALFDHAVSLNHAMNSLFNLIVDGGIGSVWGVREVQLDLVENAEDFSEGIPQGATIFKKQEAQQGVPVMTQTPAGIVPPEAMATYQLLDREFSAATLLTDTARGQISRKDVSATAVASADAASGSFFKALISDLETALMSRVLRLVWLTMLQNADDWNADDIAGILGPESAKAFAELSPARRYLMYGQGATFKAVGLSAMLERVREFQKYTAALGVISGSPLLAQAAMNKYSPDKLLERLLKSLNIDPDDMRMTPDEQATLQERLQQYPLFAMTTRGSGGGGLPGAQAPQNGPEQQEGSPTQQVQAEIAQLNQPPQGLV